MAFNGETLLLLGILCVFLLFSVPTVDSRRQKSDDRYYGDEEDDTPQTFFGRQTGEPDGVSPDGRDGDRDADVDGMRNPFDADTPDNVDPTDYDFYDPGRSRHRPYGSHRDSRRYYGGDRDHRMGHHGHHDDSDERDHHHGMGHHRGHHGSRHGMRHHGMRHHRGHHSDDRDSHHGMGHHRGHHGDDSDERDSHHGMGHHHGHHSSDRDNYYGLHAMRNQRRRHEYSRLFGMRNMDRGHHCSHHYDYNPIPPPPYDRDFLPDDVDDDELPIINDSPASRRIQRRRRRMSSRRGGRRRSRIQVFFTNTAGKNWWEGPNVCKTKTQDVNNVTDGEFQKHNIVYSKECDQSETSVRCKTTIVENGEKLVETEVLECCAGWSRSRGDFGCNIAIELVNLVELLEKEDLTEFLSAARAMGLEKELSQENVTVFAPLNSGFHQDGEAILPKISEQGKDFPLTNVVIVSKPSAMKYMDDIRALLLGHMVPDVMKSSNMFDDQLVPTGSPFKSGIRINFYNHPVKMMTANCVKVTSPNLQATNGVVHVVEKILNPVSDSLLDQITSHPELSFLKGVIGKVGFVQMLDEEGHMTVFAPTNAAFKKLDKKVLDKLTNEEDECTQMILKNHILPNIICSAPIQGRVLTPNLLGRHLQLHRDEDGKLFVDNAQIVVRDIMTTNGVLYLIDEVVVPDGAKTFLEIAEIENAGRFVELVAKSDLTNELNTLKNVTVFLPTDEATEALINKYPQDSVKKPEDLEKLRTILRYHIALGASTTKRFYNDKVIDTLLEDDRKLRINEYSMFSFDTAWTHTVQCARIASRSIQTCNGIVYLVDKVLTPPEGDIMHMLSLDKRLTTFVSLLKKSGMADKIESFTSPVTVFAPTNSAFSRLSSRERERLQEDLDSMSSYVSEGTMCCASLNQGNSWFSRSRRSKPSFHGADIIACDKMATNGVIHIIDGVLVDRKRSPYIMGFFDLNNLFM